MTYYAHWNPKTTEYCTVKFYNGNTLVKTMQVVKGNAIGQLAAAPSAPTGHTFTGWYTKREGGVRATETKIIKNDLNLYAQWDASMHVITWNPNYSGGATTTWTRAYGTELGDLPELSRPGYRQNGWWTAQSGGSQISRTT